MPEAKVTMDPFFDTRVDIIRKVRARERLVNICIRPSVIFITKTNTGCKSGDTCLFLHYKVDEQPNTKGQKRAIIPKMEEKATTKMLWPL